MYLQFEGDSPMVEELQGGVVGPAAGYALA
jgi:hypothetical protein